MDKYKYKILNPGGNKTALVIGNEYSDENKKKINDDILKKYNDVEQVGFLSTKEKRLEMAGGEFCANATRCAIWEYLNGKTGEIDIFVSGVEGRITGGINKKKEVYVKIPIEKEISDIIVKDNEFNFINLEGILLAVISERDSIGYIKNLKKNVEETKKELKELMKNFNTPEKAVGIIFLEEKDKLVKIYPVIWVKSVDTVYFETACGSGSLATAIYLNSVRNINSLKILQT